MKELDEYYEVLGVNPGASKEEVRAAYLDLVKVWHPDRFANEPQRLLHRAEEQLKINLWAFGGPIALALSSACGRYQGGERDCARHLGRGDLWQTGRPVRRRPQEWPSGTAKTGSCHP